MVGGKVVEGNAVAAAGGGGGGRRRRRAAEASKTHFFFFDFFLRLSDKLSHEGLEGRGGGGRNRQTVYKLQHVKGAKSVENQ